MCKIKNIFYFFREPSLLLNNFSHGKFFLIDMTLKFYSIYALSTRLTLVLLFNSTISSEEILLLLSARLILKVQVLPCLLSICICSSASKSFSMAMHLFPEKSNFCALAYHPYLCLHYSFDIY